MNYQRQKEDKVDSVTQESSIVDLINAFRPNLSKQLEFLPPEVVSGMVDDCINLMKLSVLKEAEKSGELTTDVLKIVRELNTIDFIVCSDIMQMISRMNFLARENSHGAATLSKIFVNPLTYKQITSDRDIPENAQIKVFGAYIV